MKIHGSKCAVALGFLLIITSSGCSTSRPSFITDEQSVPAAAMTYECGDELEITFFGAPELNITQLIRRDGLIALRLVGDIKAAGLRPDELSQALRAAYAQQLQIKDISVVVRGASPVLVTGEVMRPGRIALQRPMTALDAIMEAGGFDLEDAELREVAVIRVKGDKQHRIVLDLREVLHEKYLSKPFYLAPFDLIYVPRRWDR